MCFTEIWEKATCFLSRNPLGLGWKLPQRQPLDSLGSTSICEAAGWPTGPKCLLQCFGASLGTETCRSTHFCYLFFWGWKKQTSMTCMDICGHMILHTDICWLFISNYFFAKKTYHQKKATQRKKIDWSTDDSFEKRPNLYSWCINISWMRVGPTWILNPWIATGQSNKTPSTPGVMGR